MEQTRDLTPNKKSTIVPEFGKLKTTTKLLKILGRDYRTVKNFVQFPNSAWPRADKDESRFASNRTLSCVKKEVV